MNITKFQLLNALLTGGSLAGLRIVNQVAREDGSGRCFNVTGHDATGRECTVFVRTVD